ncbi:hypothetical protein JVU11DRAFT_3318 [Chiua virens]|nr:hypothetical protein JVU11DRAFT_3318 [Chiua virens]
MPGKTGFVRRGDCNAHCVPLPWADSSIGPALVTSITYANTSFYGCAFSSWQDTWYTGYAAYTYAVDSIIYGETDYIFGLGAA